MIRANEPAFPSDEHNATDGRFDNRYGLTIREYFAAMAMQGLLAMSPDAYDGKPELTARIAVFHADALIAELAKENQA